MSQKDPDEDKTHTHHILSEGVAVGHYRIIEKIGAGGMGEVFLAEDTKLKRQVALKFLPEYLVSNDDAKLRFTREAQAAAGLTHPNIVTIHEVSEYNGRPFFAMECCEGKPLRDVIKEDRLSTEQIIDMALQICEGLQEAHEAGIVHRDIKPSNIILDKSGRPKIADFGLAAVQGSDKLTKTGSTLGTIGYMSPEQIQVKNIDKRSDLFSFGVMLYEMITGRMPFQGETEASTLNSVLNDTPEPLSRYKSGVSGELQRIVSKLLEKKPELRYQTAAGVIAALKKLAVDLPSSAKPRKDWWNRYVVTGAVAILGIMLGYWLISDEGIIQKGGSDSDRKTLAVLPFENLGNPDDAYFADGMTDEITARLASIHELRVTSRTSAMQYRDSDKSIKQIGKELGVAYILEGTIRWDKSGDTDRVRIIPQLIQVSDDSHIWANTFEREITQVFAVQADIATQISEALGIALLEPERKTMESEPTKNMEAYHYYLRGKSQWDDRQGAVPAIGFLEKAVEIDTTFSKAYGLLARLYGFMHINNLDASAECFEKARNAAEKALKYSNGHSVGNLAMGYFHYYFSRDYDLALEQFEEARKEQPNNSELLEAIGYVLRRQGHWEEALENQQKAHSLDPMNLGIYNGLIRTLFNMHRIAETAKMIDWGFEFEIKLPAIYLWKLWLVASETGDTSKVREAFLDFEKNADKPTFEYWAEIIDLYFRDFESGVQRRKIPGEYFMTNYSEFYRSKGLFYALMGRNEISRAYYDSAKVECERKLLAQPDNPYSHSNLARAYAGLGRYKDAIREAKTAIEIMPVTKDALTGPVMLEVLADVYVAAGEYESAIDLIDTLLRIPSSVQVTGFRFSPVYDPLRANPRFENMLQKYELAHGIR